MLWIDAIFGRLGPHSHAQISTLVQIWIRECFCEDAWMARKFLIPKLQDSRSSDGRSHALAAQMLETLDAIEAADQAVPEIWRRSDATLQVDYRVGQLVKHRRYGWIGAICGWSLASSMTVPSEFNSGSETRPVLRQSNDTVFFSCL